MGALVDENKFSSERTEYVPVKTEDGNGVKIAKSDTRIQAYLVPPYFDKNTYQYGDTMTVTLELQANGKPIAGETIEVNAGNLFPYPIMDTVVTDAEGKAIATVEVNDLLWPNRSHLGADYWGSAEYKGNHYGVSLKGEGDYAGGDMDIYVIPADIALAEIAAPALGAVPPATLGVDPNAFYTAEVVWSPNHATFQAETEYTASIRLIPRTGYSLDSDRISSITYKGQSVTIPAPEKDGSLLLTDALRFEAIPVVHVTEVTLNQSTLSLTTGGTATLTASIIPADAANRTISWSSSDPAVATVDASGNVTAVSVGTAAITVTAADGGLAAACTVTVTAPRAPSTSGGGSGASGAAALPVSTTGQNNSAVTTTTTAAPAADNRGGTASATVSGAVGSEIIRQAVENNSESVVIAPGITGDVTGAEISVPASTVGEIGSKTGAGLTVSTPLADVTIPNGALSSLSAAGGTVTVAAARKDGAVELTVTAGGRTVVNIPGGVALTVPVSDAAPGTVAVLVHEDGTREVVRKSVAEGGSITIALDGSARLEIADNSKQYSDVPAGGWAADAVAFVSAHELFSGTGGGQFSPDLPMSRGMLAVVLYNLEGSPEQAFTGVFADVSMGAWYAGGVAWAAENGIVKGYGGGLFGPDDSITREQLAVMLWRYAGSPAADGELDFKDADTVSGYALEAVRWAVDNGILNGCGDGLLAPRGTATRAQAAQMLKNYMGRLF